jgi:hypothetical protein
MSTKLSAAALLLLLHLTVSPAVHASGPVGIYGIVERVVFEPSEQSPERIRVFGAFALVDGGVSNPLGATAATRGYLYFSLPEDGTLQQAARAEWADLKAVAGTGQAVGFGNYIYIGAFSGLQTDSPNGSPPRSRPPYTLRPVPGGGAQADLWVQPESKQAAEPVIYSTNSGIVKLPAQGSHAAIVSQLRQAVGRR